MGLKPTTKKDKDFKYTRGNLKLGTDTLILNMGSGTSCPSKRLGLCEITNAGKKCYALKAERLYPGCLPFREAQKQQWENKSAKQIADQLLAVAHRARNKNIRFFRFSEAGDFEGRKDVVKMDKVAGILKKEGITTYGYAARKDLNLTHKNMVVNCSGFTKPGCDNIYRGVAKLTPKVPHFPAAHTWYASATIKDCVIVKVK